MTFACATSAEERAARRAGLQTARVGLAACRALPEGPVVSFGLAGGLADDVSCGDVIDATRVVGRGGVLLWQGAPVGAPSAREGTVLAADRLIDDPEERRRLHVETGALVVDLESGPLAATGRLVGCIRVVSDTPARTLGGMAAGVKADGTIDYGGIGRAFVRSPRAFTRAAGDARRALRKLRRIAEAVA